MATSETVEKEVVIFEREDSKVLERFFSSSSAWMHLFFVQPPHRNLSNLFKQD